MMQQPARLATDQELQQTSFSIIRLAADEFLHLSMLTPPDPQQLGSCISTHWCLQESNCIHSRSRPVMYNNSNCTLVNKKTKHHFLIKWFAKEKLATLNLLSCLCYLCLVCYQSHYLQKFFFGGLMYLMPPTTKYDSVQELPLNMRHIILSWIFSILFCNFKAQGLRSIYWS